MVSILRGRGGRGRGRGNGGEGRNKSDKNAKYSVVSNGAGFFLACEDFWRMFDHSFPACVFVVVVVSVVFFFFNWRLARAH